MTGRWRTNGQNVMKFPPVTYFHPTVCDVGGLDAETGAGVVSPIEGIGDAAEAGLQRAMSMLIRERAGMQELR